MTSRDPRIEKIRHRLGYGWSPDELLLLIDAENVALREKLRKIASQCHNLPRSATADIIDQLARNPGNGQSAGDGT